MGNGCMESAWDVPAEHPARRAPLADALGRAAAAEPLRVVKTLGDTHGYSGGTSHKCPRRPGPQFAGSLCSSSTWRRREPASSALRRRCTASRLRMISSSARPARRWRFRLRMRGHGMFQHHPAHVEGVRSASASQRGPATSRAGTRTEASRRLARSEPRKPAQCPLAIPLPSRAGGFSAELDRSRSLAHPFCHLGEPLVLKRRALVRLGRLAMSELRVSLRSLDPLAAFRFFHWGAPLMCQIPPGGDQKPIMASAPTSRATTARRSFRGERRPLSRLSVVANIGAGSCSFERPSGRGNEDGPGAGGHGPSSSCRSSPIPVRDAGRRCPGNCGQPQPRLACADYLALSVDRDVAGRLRLGQICVGDPAHGIGRWWIASSRDWRESVRSSPPSAGTIVKAIPPSQSAPGSAGPSNDHEWMIVQRAKGHHRKAANPLTEASSSARLRAGAFRTPSATPSCSATHWA